MTLTQLTYIIALADSGHFGRAAGACFVSQPTLSMQIQKLEQELGILLFDRSLQPVRPTGQGEQIVAQARIILAERDRLYSLLNEEGPLVGELQVGIIPTLATYLIPLVTPVLMKECPGISLSVEELTTSHLLVRLASGQLDAGLIATEESRPGLEIRRIFREPFVGYLNDGHKLSAAKRLRPADLTTLDLWLLQEGHCLRDQVIQICDRSHRPSNCGVRFESGNLETLRYLVDHLGGITLLPMLATHYFDADTMQRIRLFESPAPSREIHLVYSRASVKQRFIDAFAKAIQETVEPVLKTMGLRTEQLKN